MIVIGFVLIGIALLAGALALYLVLVPGSMGAGYVLGFMIGLSALVVGLLGGALVGLGRRASTPERDPDSGADAPFHRLGAT